MSYLLDTDWFIQALNGRLLAAQTLRRLEGSRIAVSLATVAEVYEGAYRSSNPRAHLVSVRHFLSIYYVYGLDDAIAERFGELRAYLRRRGERIPDFDLLIAATALEYDLTVLTFDRKHYSRVPDLRLYQPDPR